MIPAAYISTTFDIAGHDTVGTLGEVMGLTVRSRNVFSVFGSTFKSLFGGELKGQTKVLMDSRMQVMQRMCEEAERRGGNAVLGMRFDASELGKGWTAICAYGTAVRVTPRT
jgi:uncharacterized protein YbjQ (UPF0145 family)